MVKMNERKPSLRYYERIINRFAEKAQLLAAEAYSIFENEKEICKIIGVIVVHQATELALKALCLQQENTIFQKGKVTIDFDTALQRCTNVIQFDEMILLKDLNGRRNDYQHNALFDRSNFEDLRDLLLDTLAITSKILKHMGYATGEIDFILDKENSLDNENNTKLDMGVV